MVFPEKDDREISQLSRKTFHSLGRAMSELIHMSTVWEQREQRLEFVADKRSEEWIRCQKPTVFVIAHTGAWQYANFLAAEFDIPTAIIYAPEANPSLEKVFLKLRRAFQTRLVSRDGGLRVLMHELRHGNSVGLAIDTRLDGAEMIPLFGAEAPTNTAPARLALRYKCQVIPVHVERLPACRYRIWVDEPVTPDDVSVPASQQAIEMTHKLNRIFERWITQAPGQWICLKRRWPKDAYARR